MQCLLLAQSVDSLRCEGSEAIEASYNPSAFLSSTSRWDIPGSDAIHLRVMCS